MKTIRLLLALGVASVLASAAYANCGTCGKDAHKEGEKKDCPADCTKECCKKPAPEKDAPPSPPKTE